MILASVSIDMCVHCQGPGGRCFACCKVEKGDLVSSEPHRLSCGLHARGRNPLAHNHSMHMHGENMKVRNQRATERCVCQSQAERLAYKTSFLSCRLNCFWGC